MKRKILLLVLMFLPIMANAYDAEIDGIYYNFSGSKAIVTYRDSQYSSYSGSVTIPESVSYNGQTYSVTDINGWAFAYCFDLNSITIPNSVTSIGDFAFQYCRVLKSVAIPDGVTSIGYQTFGHCSALTSVTIPNSVTSIGERAFDGCSSLQSATIPSSVTEIGERAFEGCESLTTAAIPDGVKTISNRTFFGCTSLTSLTIGNGVTSIGMSAFAGCRLTSLVIPNNVTSIGAFAFANCSDLTSVTFPNSLTSIGSQAFEACDKLTSLTIPNSVSFIANDAFFGCSGLTSFVIDKGNTMYDSRDNCNAIIETESNTLIWGCMNTIIPNSVTSIGSYAFQVCEGLTSVNIPEGVTSIGEGAFDRCSNLKIVSIPRSITYIGSCTFAGCFNLTDFYCYAENVPKTEYDLFGDVPTPFFYHERPHESATLHVPAVSIEKYKATEPWKDFGNIVALDNPNDTLHNHPKYYQDGDYWVQALVPWDFEERIHDYETEGSGENFSLYCFYVEGDTIIDNKEYKCVHARTWIYEGEETYGHQPKGLVEGIQIPDVLFMREDADGRQWRRLASLSEEALLFDFGSPFEKGKKIRYCLHEHLNDVMEAISYEDKVHSDPSHHKGIKAEFSDEAPEGYLYYDLEISNVSSIELPNGEQVPFANERIAFGWGDVYQGDLFHQFLPLCESLKGMFLYRVHQGQVILQNKNNIIKINDIIGKDVLSLFNKPKDANKYFTKNQMATIILPTEPDASKGRYYRLDRCEKGKIIFEEELSPKARTPYIIVPKEDFSIDLNALDLVGLLRDTVSVKGASFIGSYSHEELSCQDGFYIDIIDATPDCQADDSNQRKAIVGALRACLIVNWDDPYNPGGSKGITEKRELVLNDNPNGIESLIPDPSPREKGTIYDLSGRKVNSQFSILNSQLKQKGLYIEDGKKILIK